MILFDDDRDDVFALLEYEPHEAQRVPLLCEKRFVLISGGMQSGKSLLASKFLLSRYLDRVEDEAALYWLVAADYERTRAEFEYLREDFMKLGVLKRESKRIDPGFLELADGTRIETKSAKDPRTLAMKGVDGILACEASQLDLNIFYRLNERIAPKRGWLLLSGTIELEGSIGWYPQLISAWEAPGQPQQSFRMATYDNLTLFPGGRTDPEILRLEMDSSDQFFMERIEGKPSPPTGLVFPEFRADLHVRDVNWLGPEDDVYMWEDPGYGGQSAHALLVAHIIDDQIQIFDEIYEQGLITEEIIEMAMGRPWWKSPKTLVSDPHYKDQHHSMTSVAEIWMEKTGLYAGGEKIRINEGTERLKSFLKRDPLTQDAKLLVKPTCRGLLSEFGVVPHPLDGPNKDQTRPYRWKTDRDGVIYGETPDDSFNHSIKALIYGLVAKFGYISAGSEQVTVRRIQ